MVERGILCIILNSPRRRRHAANLSAASHVESVPQPWLFGINMSHSHCDIIGRYLRCVYLDLSFLSIYSELLKCSAPCGVLAFK